MKRSSDEDGEFYGKYSASKDITSLPNTLVGVGSTSDNERPQKKQGTTLPSWSNLAPIKAKTAISDVNVAAAKSKTSSACTALPISNKYRDELLLVWNIYGKQVEEEPIEHSISVDQIISPKGFSFMSLFDIPRIKLASKVG